MILNEVVVYQHSNAALWVATRLQERHNLDSTVLKPLQTSFVFATVAVKEQKQSPPLSR